MWVSVWQEALCALIMALDASLMAGCAAGRFCDTPLLLGWSRPPRAAGPPHLEFFIIYKYILFLS